jgi:hypothetical protein
MPASSVSTRRITPSVRFADAPSGSRTSAKNAPWSSLGKKPVGVLPASQPVSANAATSSARPITALRAMAPAIRV